MHHITFRIYTFQKTHLWYARNIAMQQKVKSKNKQSDSEQQFQSKIHAAKCKEICSSIILNITPGAGYTYVIIYFTEDNKCLCSTKQYGSYTKLQTCELPQSIASHSMQTVIWLAMRSKPIKPFNNGWIHWARKLILIWNTGRLWKSGVSMR